MRAAEMIETVKSLAGKFPGIYTVSGNDLVVRGTAIRLIPCKNEAVMVIVNGGSILISEKKFHDNLRSLVADVSFRAKTLVAMSENR